MIHTWPLVSLGDLLRLERRPVAVRADAQYQEVGIYCFGRGVFHKTPRSGLEVGDKSLFLLRQGDFVLQVTFAWEGAVAVLTAAEDGLFASTRFPTFRVDESRCVPAFLLSYFKTPEGLRQLANISPGSAGRNRVLSLKRIHEVSVPLPPLEQQRRIVARIEKTSTRIDEARRLRADTIAEAKAVAVAFARARLMMRPHWQRRSIEELCDCIIDYRGRTPPISDAGIPHLTSSNVRNGRINWSTAKYVTEDTYTKFMTRGIPQVSDVLFTMEAPLGEVAVIEEERRFSLAQRLLLLRPRRDIISGEFLAAALSGPDAQQDVLAQATATTVRGIASKRFRHLTLPLPPHSEQESIVRSLRSMRGRVEKLADWQVATTTELNALLPSILDRAFKGEL